MLSFIAEHTLNNLIIFKYRFLFKEVWNCIKDAASFIWSGIKSIINSPIGRIAIGVVIGCILGPVGGALFGLGEAGAGILGWAAAAVVGGLTTTGLGLANGVSIQQSLFEGLITFGIVSGLSRLYGVEKVPQAAMGGVSGAGGLDYRKSTTPKEASADGTRAPQGKDFQDKTFYQSSGNAAPTENAIYPGMIADRAADESPVGSTFAPKFGNYNNGAGSEAYANMHNSKPTWSETLTDCGSKLVHDHTFQTLFGLSAPISKSYAEEYHGIDRSTRFGGSSRFTNPLSMLDQTLSNDKNIPNSIKSKLKADNALFRTLASGSSNILRGTGRIIQKYAVPGYAAGYIGACIYDQQLGD